MTPPLSSPSSPGIEREPEDWRQASLEHWIKVALVPNEVGDDAYEALQKQLHEMRTSLSWRITAPLRILRRWIR